VLKAFKYRLYPTQVQAERMGWTLARCCELYNAALEERRTAYRKCGATVNYHAQAVSLPEVKEGRPEYKDVHSQVLQDTLRRLDKAFAAFFRRVKQGEKPGYPRFKSARRFDSFCYPQYKGSVSQHVYLPKIGNVRLRLHRPLEGAVKTLTVKREVDEWYAVIVCEVETKPLEPTGSEVGIDLGLNHFLITSDGEFVDAPRHFRTAQKKLRRAQRSLARKKRGSNRRAKQRERVAKLHRKVKRQRLDFHHKTARKLVREHDVVAHEALNVKGLGRTRLAKSVLDASWAQFLAILTSKAEEAGRVVVPVDPKYTSQTCPACGRVAEKLLSERWHSCECGCELQRDVAAARVILGRTSPSGANAAVVDAYVA
jgi:putative transposase